MDESEEDRWARHRARYLERGTDLRYPEALALAYSELGYTRSAIARKDPLDTTKSTVKSYHERIAAQYGIHTLNAKHPGEFDRQTELTEVTLEDVKSYPRKTREDWYKMAVRNIDDVPASEKGTAWIWSQFQFDANCIEYDGTGDPEIK